MTITNGYATLLQARKELGITDTQDDAALELAIGAASRQIDAYCGRRFYADGTAQVRYYTPADDDCCEVDDISTTSGLVVQVDTDSNNTFETTLTVDVDFYLWPRNADQPPVQPWRELRIFSGSSAYFPGACSAAFSDDQPTVKVTAKYGWPGAVPDDVTRACILQALQLFKAKDAIFGAVALGESGSMRIRSAITPVAETLLMPYRKGEHF